MRFHRVVVLKGQKRRLEKKKECWFSLLPQNMWSKGQKLGDLVEALDCRLVQQKRMSRKLTAPLLCNATQTSAHQRILGLPRTSWKHSTNLEFAWPRMTPVTVRWPNLFNSDEQQWNIVTCCTKILLPSFTAFTVLSENSGNVLHVSRRGRWQKSSSRIEHSVAVVLLM